MPKHVLIINGNPDPAPERLTSALAKAYHDGAKAGGAIVQQINIGALDFPLLRTAQEFVAAPAEAAIVAARAQILEANHLVFIYPLWLGGVPALLKAFMEQVSRGGFALSTGAHGLPAGNLKGRSARVIVTMGMPASVYRLWFGALGVRAFNRSILGISGIRPNVTTYLGALSAPRCLKWIERVRRMGRRTE